MHAFTGGLKPRIMHLSRLERLAFMGDPVLDTKTDPLAIEGMETLFIEDEPGSAEGSARISSNSNQAAPGLAEGLAQGVPVDEAAKD